MQGGYPDFKGPTKPNAPACAYCGDPVLDRCIKAVESTWHPEHFFCAQCGQLFAPGAGFLEKDGLPYCETDYFQLFGMKCAGCGKVILGEYVTALEKSWHAGCFSCMDCKKPFDNATYFDLDGYAYCEHHYHLRRGSICAACTHPIQGQACVVASSGTDDVTPSPVYRFHPEHFRCNLCGDQLATVTEGGVLKADEDGVREREGKVYCMNCFSRVFGGSGGRVGGMGYGGGGYGYGMQQQQQNYQPQQLGNGVGMGMGMGNGTRQPVGM
ncbi:hypothetical protein BJ742DRAFT_685865 [Cladochytrium replicatum]|nr:hypothetical protein BJ742DRAFT_685865 [Cladochytrium replicatum]